jgi:hypothetical protein
VLDSIDTESLKIDEEAEKLRALDLVQQYKLEMGLTGSTPTPLLEEENQPEKGREGGRGVGGGAARTTLAGDDTVHQF